MLEGSENLVYHSSSTEGLERLEPKKSTHDKVWVYATKDIPTSAMFIGRNYDLICQVGVYDGKPGLYERFEGALEYAYADQAGSIYVLNGKTFEDGKTSWEAEVVSEVSVDVLREISVENALDFLLKLEKEGKLKIYKYPNIPEGRPGDKSDLVDRVIQWVDNAESQVLKDVRRFHSDIIKDIRGPLKKKGIII
jgi:hypothetical protein